MANENKVIKKEKKGPKMGKEIEDINVVDFGDGGEYDEQDETCKKNSRGVGDIFNSCEDDVFGIE